MPPGRFGRKAQAATLREFNAEAFVMEMGITNPLMQTSRRRGLPYRRRRPAARAEISAEQLNAAMLRALPRASARVPLDFTSALGAIAFRKIGAHPAMCRTSSPARIPCARCGSRRLGYTDSCCTTWARSGDICLPGPARRVRTDR